MNINNERKYDIPYITLCMMNIMVFKISSSMHTDHESHAMQCKKNKKVTRKELKVILIVSGGND